MSLGEPIAWGVGLPIRFATGLHRDVSKLRFTREDGLVDGGTIEHLSELRASQRALHETLDPTWRHW